MKLDRATRARLAKAYGFENWNKPATSAVLASAALTSAALKGYVPHSVRRQTPSEGIVLHQILWAPDNEARPTVSTQVFEARNPAKAAELLLYLLGQFQGPQLAPMRSIGEVAFSTRGHRVVVFQRQNLAVVVSNIADKPADLSAFAGLLNGVFPAEEKKPGRIGRSRP
jgi:hypothetical protein